MECAGGCVCLRALLCKTWLRKGDRKKTETGTFLAFHLKAISLKETLDLQPEYQLLDGCEDWGGRNVYEYLPVLHDSSVSLFRLRLTRFAVASLC